MLSSAALLLMHVLKAVVGSHEIPGEVFRYSSTQYLRYENPTFWQVERALRLFPAYTTTSCREQLDNMRQCYEDVESQDSDGKITCGP